jgi:uncharacterized glyoxalase superfamily protein PhnB
MVVTSRSAGRPGEKGRALLDPVGHPFCHNVRRVLTNRSIPASTVIPVLVYRDVRAAVDWLTEAFGFVERVRIGDDHRSQMQVGQDGAVIVADVRGEQKPPRAGDVTHLIKVRVPDVDAQLERARSRGADVVQEPTEYEYGERECTVADPGGHRWQFTQTIRDVLPEEWGGQTVQPDSRCEPTSDADADAT